MHAVTMRAFAVLLACWAALGAAPVYGRATGAAATQARGIGAPDVAPAASRAPLDVAVAAAAALSRQSTATSLERAATIAPGGHCDRKSWVGVLGVLGGALCHLTLGTTYCWGNFMSYTPTKLKYFDGVGAANKPPDAMWVLAGVFVTQGLTMPIAPKLHTKIGCRATTLLGCGVMALAVFLASFAPNLATFMLTYSLMFGAGVGIAYTAPMVNGWKWFPNKKGLVSGAVVAGFGSGGFLFNQVGSKFVNPKNMHMVDGKFPSAVYDAFPSMLRKLSLIYVVMAGLGGLLITPPPSHGDGGGPVAKVAAKGKEAVAAAAGPDVGVKDALKSRTFWTMWIMVLGIAMAGINVANVYKSYAATIDALKSDSFQATVGSVAALCNGAGRLFWGNMLDGFGFHRPFGTLVSIQAVTIFLYTTRVAQSQLGFLLSTGLLLFTMGGNFSMFPAMTTKVFGPRSGATIYGYLFSAFATASIMQTFISQALKARFGWEGVFKVMSTLSVLVLAILPTFKPFPKTA